MKAERKRILLEKLLNDECTRKELEELLSFKGSSEFDSEFEKVLEAAWIESHQSEELKKLKGDEIFYNIINHSPDAVKRSSGRSSNFLSIAAAVVLVLTAAALYYWFQNSYTTKQSAYGETKEFTLPDGSEVILNANSSVSFKRNWKSDEPRIVTLEGEAFFKVTHKTNNQKFIVKAEDLKVEVLGTEFNVRSREKQSSVVLQSGSIKLAMKDQKEVIMEPGQLIEITPDKKEVKKLVVNPEKYTSWRKKLLIFESTPLSEIAEKIKETYGVEIVLSDSTLGKEKFTGVFPTNEDLSVLLTMLSTAYEFEIVKEEKTLFFKK